jgi:hypothetical protein
MGLLTGIGKNCLKLIFLIYFFTGGTLGLFAGMSIVSGVEIFMWILHCVNTLMFKKTSNQNNKIRKYKK